MVDFPTSLDMAIAQAQQATQTALAVGYTRLSVELLIPELKPMPPARQYLSVFENMGPHLKVFFTDAGTAALARRDWGNLPHTISSIDIAGARQTTEVEELIEPEDQAFLFVAPTAVEVYLVEKICTAAGERPVILFNPRLEDIGTVGLGSAARELRTRFLSLFEPCYFLRPLELITLLRFYPTPWQVWLEDNGSHRLIAEELLKPDSETLEKIVRDALGPAKTPQRSFLSNLQQFLRALGQ